MDDAVMKIAKDMATAGARLVEHRIRTALDVAGVTEADLLAGRAHASRVMENHPECNGTGVKSIWKKDRSFVTVEICPCMEINIVRPI